MEMLCVINGCGCCADTIDAATGLPMCHDCHDEINACRAGQTASLWEVAQDAFQLGVWGGLFSRMG